MITAGETVASIILVYNHLQKICVSSIWKLPYVTLMAPQILWWFLEFSKICVTLYTVK